MGFVHFNENRYLVGKDGKPMYLVGVNFVAGYCCTDFWTDWREDSIARDLDIMHEMGLNAVRIPIIWNTFEPQQGGFNPMMLERLDRFFDLCRERDIYVMPWCLVGIATEEYDVSWRNGRSFFFDEGMIQAEENHLRTLGARYAEEEQLLCWDICDEPEWYSRMSGEKLPYPEKEFTRWVQRMVDAFHSADKNHQVTLGFGHIATGRYGMDLRDCADALDFMAVTAYAEEYGEPLAMPRPEYDLIYHLNMNRRGRACFMCECPGMTNVQHTQETIAKLYNTTLFSGWLHGSCGALTWVFNDFHEELFDTSVTNRYTIEPWFGIVTESREKKLAAKVLERFAKTMREIGATDFKFRDASAALIVPRGYHRSSSGAVTKRMIMPHAALCAADIPLDMVWWDELDAEKYPLAVLTLLDECRTEDWHKLADYVEAGGTLALLAGRDGANPYYERIFGVQRDGQKRHASPVQLSFESDFGEIKAGETMEFPLERSYQRVQPVGAEVVARLSNGAPALLRNRFGKGQAFLMTVCPFDGLAECDSETYAQSCVFKLLGAMADEARAPREVVCDDASIEVGVMRSAEKTILVAINHYEDPIQAEVRVRSGALRPKHAPYAVQNGEVRIPISLRGGEEALIELCASK